MKNFDKSINKLQKLFDSKQRQIPIHIADRYIYGDVVNRILRDVLKNHNSEQEAECIYSITIQMSGLNQEKFEYSPTIVYGANLMLSNALLNDTLRMHEQYTDLAAYKIIIKSHYNNLSTTHNRQALLDDVSDNFLYSPNYSQYIQNDPTLVGRIIERIKENFQSVFANGVDELVKGYTTFNLYELVQISSNKEITASSSVIETCIKLPSTLDTIKDITRDEEDDISNW